MNLSKKPIHFTIVAMRPTHLRRHPINSMQKATLPIAGTHSRYKEGASKEPRVPIIRLPIMCQRSHFRNW
jgi:hypothetical protein